MTRGGRVGQATAVHLVTVGGWPKHRAVHTAVDNHCSS
jgi:hypothetical protein